MPKIIVSGRGGSGKSTLVTLLARTLGEQGQVLVVDTDESNLGLCRMLGHDIPEMSLMGSLGGKPAVREKLLASMQEGGGGFSPFKDNLTIDNLPAECISSDGRVKHMRIGKIEHSMEGCACPMGAVTRSFLKQLAAGENEWVLVDTEAGVEHFGRGVLEGVDIILMVVDPSHESILLAQKASQLAQEAGKSFFAVLNKVDESSETVLREELDKRRINILGTMYNSPEIMKSNLTGDSLQSGVLQDSINELAGAITKQV